ncbi:MAG: D-alanyl-D-alanine carboxypeptidase [Agathobacter sp.]|nr:D-alanyl-D-alanine carboxypeptidase [Agathobacter sp.]
MAIFVRYKERMLSFFLVLCVCVFAWYLGILVAQEEFALAQESLAMYSGSYALMDGDTGRILTGKEETQAMANASTTKILTAIVTLETCELEEVVTVSRNAASQPKVRYGIKEGQEYSLEELMYGLMLESYNDCAVAIAEHVAGSVEEFAQMLNEKAKEIGCKDTYFITPNGLDAEDENGFHHTTAEDLCKIMAYCVWESPKKDVFLKITQTRNYGPFVNRNAFLDQMEGVLSGKTGFTSKAGYCYVAALEENGERYTIALLACGWPNNKTYKWKDSKTLFTYGLENYDVKEVVIEEQIEHLELDGFINVPDFFALNQMANLQIRAEERRYNVLLAVKEWLRKEVILKEDIELPIQKGMELGECVIYLDDIKLDTIPLITTDSADYWDLSNIIEVVFRQFLSVTS